MAVVAAREVERGVPQGHEQHAASGTDVEPGQHDRPGQQPQPHADRGRAQRTGSRRRPRTAAGATTPQTTVTSSAVRTSPTRSTSPSASRPRQPSSCAVAVDEQQVAQEQQHRDDRRPAVLHEAAEVDGGAGGRCDGQADGAQRQDCRHRPPPASDPAPANGPAAEVAQRPGALPAQGHDDGRERRTHQAGQVGRPALPGVRDLAAHGHRHPPQPRERERQHHVGRQGGAGQRREPGRVRGACGGSACDERPVTVGAVRDVRAPPRRAVVRARSRRVRGPLTITSLQSYQPHRRRGRAGAGRRRPGGSEAQMSRKVSMVAPRALSRSARSS